MNKVAKLYILQTTSIKTNCFEEIFIKFQFLEEREKDIK